jgi:hypothetical protein
MRNPFPLASVHFTPAMDDPQLKGPSWIEVPYWRVGVLSPAFERHWAPAHSTKAPSVPNFTDLGGDSVRQSVPVNELPPKL